MKTAQFMYIVASCGTSALTKHHLGVSRVPCSYTYTGIEDRGAISPKQSEGTDLDDKKVVMAAVRADG
jgi:hypothetical protein